MFVKILETCKIEAGNFYRGELRELDSPTFAKLESYGWAVEASPLEIKRVFEPPPGDIELDVQNAALGVSAKITEG